MQYVLMIYCISAIHLLISLKVSIFNGFHCDNTDPCIHLLGVSPEQQKLKINAELDRLVDGGHISYNEMAEVCLTIQSTKDQLLSARTGLYGKTSP